MKKMIAGLFIASLIFSPVLLKAEPLTIEQVQRAAQKAKRQQEKSLKRGEQEAKKKKRQAEAKTKKMRKEAEKRNARMKKSLDDVGM